MPFHPVKLAMVDQYKQHGCRYTELNVILTIAVPLYIMSIASYFEYVAMCNNRPARLTFNMHKLCAYNYSNCVCSNI